MFVVDDDASVRKSLARLVKAAGYEVEAFASVSDFLARPPSRGPAACCWTCACPAGPGSICRRRSGAAGRRLSIVFITGHGDVRASVKAMKGGAVDFLTKPLDEEELLTAIEQAVAGQRENKGAGAESRRSGTVSRRSLRAKPRSSRSW